VDLHMNFWDALMDKHMGAARRALGEQTAERSWREGALIPFDEAVALALAGWKEDPPTPLSTRG